MFGVKFGFSPRRSQRRPVDPAGPARRAAGVLALLSLGAAVPARAQTPDTIVPIANRAEATFETATGLRTRVSDEEWIHLRLRPGLQLSATEPAWLCGGESHLFTHTLTNAGNGPDLITLEASYAEGTSGVLRIDADGDGLPGDADPEITGPIELGRGESVVVFLQVETEPVLEDVELEVGLTARSSVHAAARAGIVNRLSICGPPPILGLAQSADRSLVSFGDTVGFTFEIVNSGEDPSRSAVVADTLPASLFLLPGSVVRDTTVLAPGEGSFTADTLEDGRTLLQVPLDTIPGGGERTVRFRAIVVADTAVTSIVNVAHVRERDQVGESNPVEIDVEFPRVELVLRVLGRSIIYVGDEVTFELAYRNVSNIPVADARLTNILPPELSYLGAEPRPSRTSEDASAGGGAGGTVGTDSTGGTGGAGEVDIGSRDWVEWDLGTIEPGQQGRLLLHTRLDEVPAGGGNRLENYATLSAGAAGYRVTVTALTVPIAIGEQAHEDASLTLRKSAGRMEVGLGEAVPYALEVENSGAIPLNDVVIRGWLPDELDLVAGSVTGADSVRVEGSEALLHLPGPLMPGATHLVRYVAIATGAPGEPIANRARAEAEIGRVASDTATAWVRVRQGPSVSARTLIGKVWVDHDGNGRQDPGDEGLAGVDIWTADGQVVRTDPDGRFSLQDLEPGRYTLRIDMLGLEDRYEIAGEGRGREIREVRLDGWTMGRVEFRLVPRRVAIDYHAGPPAALLAASGVAETLAEKAADDAPGPVRAAAARTADDRAAERRRELVAGPGIEFTSPGDGSVLAASRTYIGVRGEPGRRVELLGEDGLIREGTIRPDGIFDFIAVDLEPGPNLFRVRSTNSWGNERWDSIAVHRSGSPAAFLIESSPRALRAEAPETEFVLVRVHDEWSVPVVNTPLVTVEAAGLTIEAEDADPSSAGLQLRPDSTGWLRIPIRAGGEVGPARLVLQADEAELELPLQVLAPVRPVIATFAGRLGFGGAEDGSFASITARGALDEITSITVSYDSRRGDEMAAFRRDYDPLSESLYPTLGDRSERRVLAGSGDAFSARIERGLDWIALGDVRTEGFAGAGELTTYDRSLSGVTSRLSTGPVVMHGFGSATRQRLEEIQLRGEGSSGPYLLGGEIRPGTDRLSIEIRARDNAARILSRNQLTRYSDYQIDYRTGEILLNRLLPATDAHGNPIFLVAIVERLGTDERHWVGGLRLEFDASEALKVSRADSVGISIFGIRDGAAAVAMALGTPGSDLMGGELHARLGASSFGAELLQASSDSTGLAGRVSLEWAPRQERGRVRGEWLSIGDGFSQRQNPRLRSGLEEIRIGGDLGIADGFKVHLDHDRQNFRAFDIERQSSRARVEHTRGEQSYSVEGGLIRESRGGGSTGNSLLTRVNATLSPALTLWAENRRLLKEPDEAPSAGLTGTDQIGAGLSIRILERLRLDGQYRRIDAEKPYTLSSFTANIDSWKGGRVWGGVERADGGRQESGLNLGWSQTLELPAGWSLSSQLERRFGLDDLALTDPLRALPFPQLERNRTTGGLGVQWRGTAGDRSFSARGEFNDGELNSGYRFESLGDLSIGRDAALLMRHDWLLNQRTTAKGTETDRRDHSLLGLAFRPTSSNTLNVLAKIEWRRTLRPETYSDPTLAGDNARLIGATDIAWTPLPETQAIFRYAIRGASYSNQAYGELEVRSTSHFFGSSVEQHLHRRFSGRLDSRLLRLGTTGGNRWSIAPTIVFDLSELEVETGYRFGNLKDIDFAGRGGLGFFASIGLRLTERSAASAVEFWRRQVAAQ